MLHINISRINRLFVLLCLTAPLSTCHSFANEGDSDFQFSRLDKDQTGIEFVSRLIPDHEYGYLYHSGMTCSGLAVGDLNGDGWPDLMLANGPGKNAVYFHTGEGISFKDVTNTIGEGLDGGNRWAAGVSFADVDNDGDLDIYVCNYESANQLFINTGTDPDGTVKFVDSASPAGIDVVDASHMSSFCDYDNDGDLDLFVLTNRVEYPKGSLSDLPVEFERPGVPKLLPGYERSFDLWVYDANNWGVEPIGRSDYLFRNDGVDDDGNVAFTNVSEQSGITGRGDGLSCLWWDADLDGDSDLYVCNDFISPDRFFINNGDGTFTNQIAEAVPHSCWFSMGSNFGDLDNDGDFDMLVADMSATTHYKSKVTMGAMGGMNLKRANTSTPPQYMRNSLYINEGNLLFREGAYLAGLASSDWTWSVKMNDFDMDGLLDIYLTNGVPREMNHSDINITQDMLAGKHMWEFFKEGEMRKEQNRAFRNKGEFGFEEVSNQWGLDHMGASYGAVTADLDRDGDLDMVVMNLEENISVYRNNASDKSYLVVELKGTQANRFGVGAVVKVKAGSRSWIRQLIPAAGYHSSDEPIVHFGLGDIEKLDSVTVVWPGGAKQTLNDVKTNQRLVLKQSIEKPMDAPSDSNRSWFAKSDKLNSWHRENEFNDFGLQSLLPHELSAEGPCMVVADVNGDEIEDIFIGGSAGSAAQLKLADGKGNYVLADIPDFVKFAAGEDSDAVIGDFDSDGDMDLLVARGSYEFDEGSDELQNILFWNDGNGNFERANDQLLPDSKSNSGSVATADFDNDGDLDVFIGTRVLHGQYPVSGQSELWINDSGKFRIASDFDQTNNLGMVTDATWSDVDQDGWPDLLVAREWDSIALFKNEKGKLVASTNSSDLDKRTGWWKSLDTGDVDGDGDIDILATNIGLNTKYKTSLKKPMTLYFGKFDDTGKAHIVEVKREGDACYPERGRSCSSHAMPFIADKFETYHEFGLASLSDIYGDEKLDAALKFEANTFEHGIFENKGNGDFVFRPLNRISQIAPSSAGRLADLDNDGDLDVILGQNFLRPQSETSRYDGGLGQILINSGSGKMSPLSVEESGFVIRDAVTAIGILDTNNDGQQDFVVTTNNGPASVFIRQPNNP